MIYTAKQLKDFAAYERVRKGGKFNMFDPRARRATELDAEDYYFVMHNYSDLKAVVELDGKTTKSK